MRNRQGYMINPLTGRQVKMNGKAAKNIYKMVGGSQTPEYNTLLDAQPVNNTDLSVVSDQLNQSAEKMQQNLNEKKQEIDTVQEAMKAAESVKAEAEKMKGDAESAIETASTEKDAALQREVVIKEDLVELTKVIQNLKSSLEKTSKKANETDTSPFCTFDRLDRAFDDEEKEKIKSDEGKQLFDEMSSFVGSVSNLVSTTVKYLGLFSSETRGRRAQQNYNVNDSNVAGMLGGARKRRNRRSSRKNK